jgi:hypothetical protein
MLLNNPKGDPLYQGSKPVICEFCKTGDKIDEKKLGRIYGPFKFKLKKN